MAISQAKTTQTCGFRRGCIRFNGRCRPNANREVSRIGDFGKGLPPTVDSRADLISESHGRNLAAADAERVPRNSTLATASGGWRNTPGGRFANGAAAGKADAGPNTQSRSIPRADHGWKGDWDRQWIWRSVAGCKRNWRAGLAVILH